MTSQTRRGVLCGAGGAGLALSVAAFEARLGAALPFGMHVPQGLTPVALAQEPEGAAAALGKAELTVLNDRPANLETPPHMLDDDVTPAERLFVRNNGLPPVLDDDAADTWRLTIDGEVAEPLDLSIADLRARFETVSAQLVLECAGNGRRFYQPGASGNQWGFGGVGCPRWTGVRLADVLAAAGVTNTAVYTAHYGADLHLSGDPEKRPISRGVPIAKAQEPDNLIAWAMNDAPIPSIHGAPLRLVIPGWPASCSQKWLTRISVRDQVHDGAKMTGQAYRMPAYPVAPGTVVPDEDMLIIHAMPVKSVITAPETGARVALGAAFEARGHAWTGDGEVARVDVSLDFGATWTAADLAPAPNRYAWRRWRAALTPPMAGYYEVWARATDDRGRAQPPMPPGWNPKGYLNNMQHRVAVFAV